MDGAAPLSAGIGHLEILAELGFDMCDISLREPSELDLVDLERFMSEVAPSLR